MDIKLDHVWCTCFVTSSTQLMVITLAGNGEWLDDGIINTLGWRSCGVTK